MANNQWIRIYLFTIIDYLPIVDSDHVPILLDTSIKQFPNSKVLDLKLNGG